MSSSKFKTFDEDKQERILGNIVPNSLQMLQQVEWLTKFYRWDEARRSKDGHSRQ
jgi:hypothetical protein